MNNIEKLEDRPKTIFCDIDGTILKHQVNLYGMYKNKPEILPGVLDKLKTWKDLNYQVIFTTGREESYIPSLSDCYRDVDEKIIFMKEITYKHLEAVGISKDLFRTIIFDCTAGIRVLINDTKPFTDEPTTISFTVKRDKGLTEINI